MSKAIKDRRQFLQAAALAACAASLGDRVLGDTTRQNSDSLAALHSADLTTSAREILNFNDGWKFLLSDAEISYYMPNAPDASWRQLSVPHDWAFEAPFDRHAAQGATGAYKPGGVGWYRKTFDLPPGWQHRRVRIQFDGVYMNSDVWINGVHLGKRPYGYVSFGYDLTPHLNAKNNIVAVRVDNSLEPSARWYHACGIYSPVHLIATGRVHIQHDGIFITTPRISAARAMMDVQTELINTQASSAEAKVYVTVLNPSGGLAAQTIENVAIHAGGRKTIRQSLVISWPQRWDLDTPHLYKVVVRVMVEGQWVDAVTTPFGIRSIRWDTHSGFWLNGRNIKLQGMCDHLEAGPVGGAVPHELWRWRIDLLKRMGCNAMRTAHNPRPPEFYNLCDQMGMLVLDEFFDGWRQKAPEDYGKQAFAEWWQRDLSDTVRRDRNHACVFIWSVGNETRGAVGPELVRLCHSLDATRMVTSGAADPAAMEVMGINGGSGQPTFYRKPPPQKPFVATENPHTWATRGFYRTQSWFSHGTAGQGTLTFACPNLTPHEIFTYDWINPKDRKNRMQTYRSSYDNSMVRITSRRSWQLARDLPWFSGEFRWTGFDYFGEAGYIQGGWPFHAFQGGALDLAGFKKDLYYFYQSQWTSQPMVHILPHWTHPTMQPGTQIPVWVYTNCEHVELWLNGRSLGTRAPGRAWDKLQCSWLVPWTPGKLEAIGYRGGQRVAYECQQTAREPAALKLAVSGETCPIITITQVDQAGIMNPYAGNRVYYSIDGPARILSLESGSPNDNDPNYGVTSRAAFYGLARAFLQTTADNGDISMAVGAICGDKSLLTSHRIAIDVQSLAVRGAHQPGKFHIMYSTDGSRPSMVYTGPFHLKEPTTVRADVFSGSKPVLEMSERFATDAGLYWGIG